MIDDGVIENVSLQELNTRLLTAYGMLDDKFSQDVRRALQFAIALTIVMIGDAPGLVQMIAGDLAARIMTVKAKQGDA